MKKKLINYLLTIIICFVLVGCSTQNNNNKVSNAYYGNEWPTAEIVNDVPKITEGKIEYYLSDGFISIYVSDISEDTAKEYIETLEDNGFTENLNQDNKDTYFVGSNIEGKKLTVSYNNEKLTIYINE